MDKSVLKSRAIQISLISVIANILLSIIKLIAGLLGHSQALVADAVHSASDVITTLIVIVSLIISSKGADEDHEYGHQKFESLAALLLACLLAQVGLKIGYTGVTAIYDGSYKSIQITSMFTAGAAILSIVVKEVMFRITMRTAKMEGSNALKADAWHHRSDALSSVGSLIGVIFAVLGFPIMDCVASIIICVFILKSALDIGLDAARVLTDSACDKKTEKALLDMVNNINEVYQVDMLKTRMFGSGIYVDLEIQVDGKLSFEEAHKIAEQVHDSVEKEFPSVWHCMVHANPAE